MRIAAILSLACLVSPAGAAAGLTPLNELGPGTYLGVQGGLYPGGANVPPPGHFDAAFAEAHEVVPRDAAGNPSSDGLIGWVSIGMSNTTQEFKVFERDSDADPRRNARVVLVNGAAGGMSSQEWRDIAHPVWTMLEERLEAAGLAAAQVQVVWLKTAQGAPATTAFPAHALDLENDLRLIVRNLRDRFPNARLCYLSSRIYGGWSDRPDRGEPLSYETGFSVKWLIEDQIAGDPGLEFDPVRGPVEAPLLLWGPYLWADGEVPRADGLAWLREDLEADAIHPSPSGERKVGDLLLRFFEVEETARAWWGPDDGTDRVAIDAIADASVDSASPSLNNGGNTFLRTVGVISVGRAYLKFDVGGRDVVHAKLSLRTLSEGLGLLRSSADTGWSEAAITWANAPPPDPGSLGAIPKWSHDSSMAHDVTGTVGADADGVVTLVVEGADATVRRWQARESGEPPRLILTVPTARITLRLEKDLASAGVVLRWNDTGLRPFAVRRALGPTPADFEKAVSTPVPGTEFSDAGALDDSQSYWYLVD
jgi:hypothetical protein